MNGTIKNNRRSGLELLKIISFCMIVMDHTVEILSKGGGYPIDVNMATGNFVGILCLMLHYLGMMADVIFIGCSAWFLIDDDRVKGKKIARFLGDQYFITGIFIILAYLMRYSI